MLYLWFNTRGCSAVTNSKDIKAVSFGEELGKSSSFDFAIHVSNKAYGLVTPKITYIIVYDDYADMEDSGNRGKVIFRGRVASVSESSEDGFKQVKCADGLSILNDSYFRSPFTFKAGTSVNSIFSQILFNTGYGGHNEQVNNDPYRTFRELLWSPNNMATAFPTPHNQGILTNNISLSGSSTMDALGTLADEIDWEYRLIVHDEPPFYQIAFAPRFGYLSRTPIATGINLKSLSKDRDYGEFYTRILPMGGECYNGSRLTLYGDRYVLPTTLAMPSLEDEWHDYIDDVDRKQYVDNVKLVNKYGIYEKLVIYDDVVANTPDSIPAARHNLYARAEAEARKLSENKPEIKVNGYDLYRAGYDMEELKVGNYFRCIDTVTGTIAVCRLKAKSWTLEKPFEPSLTLEYDDTNMEGEIK